MYRHVGKFAQKNREFFESEARKREVEANDELAIGGHYAFQYKLIVFHRRRDNQGRVRVFRSIFMSGSRRVLESRMKKGAGYRLFFRINNGAMELIQWAGDSILRTEWESNDPRK